NEYLDEVCPDPRAMPADPYRRAVTRIVIDQINTGFVPAMYRLLMNQDRGRHLALVEDALATWRALDALLMRHNPDGVWLWDAFGMADLSVATFFHRYCLNAHYRGFVLPDTPETARIR